jgi:hypothetical protein
MDMGKLGHIAACVAVVALLFVLIAYAPPPDFDVL